MIVHAVSTSLRHVKRVVCVVSQGLMVRQPVLKTLHPRALRAQGGNIPRRQVLLFAHIAAAVCTKTCQAKAGAKSAPEDSIIGMKAAYRANTVIWDHTPARKGARIACLGSVVKVGSSSLARVKRARACAPNVHRQHGAQAQLVGSGHAPTKLCAMQVNTWPVRAPRQQDSARLVNPVCTWHRALHTAIMLAPAAGRADLEQSRQPAATELVYNVKLASLATLGRATVKVALQASTATWTSRRAVNCIARNVITAKFGGHHGHGAQRHVVGAHRRAIC